MSSARRAAKELSEIFVPVELTPTQENHLYLLWLVAGWERALLELIYAPLFADGLLERCAARFGHPIPEGQHDGMP